MIIDLRTGAYNTYSDPAPARGQEEVSTLQVCCLYLLSSLQVAMAPQLRGLLKKKLAREILTSLGLGLVAGAGYWYAIVLPRRRRYEDFYRNYDAKAVAQSMTASFEEEGGH